MNDIYINIKYENEWIRKYFEGKDLITINELIGVIEDLDGEVQNLRERIQDMENDERENPNAYEEWDEHRRYYE